MSKFSSLFFAILAAFCAVLAIIGGYSQGIILFGDTDLTYHFGEKFFSFGPTYLWNDHFQSGSMDYNKFQGFFVKKLIFIINQLVNNLYFFSYLWYSLTFFLYTITFYFLIRALQSAFVTKEKQPVLSAIILSIFSLINGIFIVYTGQVLVLLGLVVLNVFLIYFVKNLAYLNTHHKNNYLYVFIMALTMGETAVYIQVPILLFYGLFVLALFYYKFILRYWKQLVLQWLIVGVVALLLNASWIFPLLTQQLTSSISYFQLANYDPELAIRQAEQISSSVYLNELLRLKAYSTYSDVWPGWYILGTIPVALFIWGLIKLQKNYFLVSLLFLFSLSIFFAYGIHPPTKGLYMIFWSVIPVFETFRTVMKFAFISLYVIVIALTYILSHTHNQKTKYIFLTGIVFFIIGSYAFFRHPELTRTYTQYRVPDYYSALKDEPLLAENNHSASSMLLPGLNWLTQYKWAPPYIDGMNILPFFLNESILVNNAQYIPDAQFIYNLVFDHYIRTNNKQDLMSLLSYGNIDTFIYQNDIRFANEPIAHKALAPDFGTVQKTLSNKEICSEYVQEGELHICQINQELFTPIIHPTNDIVQVFATPFSNLMNESTFIMADLKTLKINQTNSVMYFQSGQSNIPNATNVYMSSKSFYASPCANNSECMLYMSVNIPAGKYKVYLKHTKTSAEELTMTNIANLQMYFGVDQNYLVESVNKLNSDQAIQPPAQFTSQQMVPIKVDSEGIFLGEIELNGSNMVFQTENTDFLANSRFYFVNENNPTRPTPESLPQIEFAKIDPTRYYVRVHRAKGSFILNFLQNFHSAWKIHTLTKSPPTTFADNPVQRSIENSGLKKKFTDSSPAIAKTIDDQVHFTANAFANAWLLDLNSICEQSTCTLNPDGTVDLDLLIEFSLQHSLAMGLTISMLTFFACIIAILYSAWKVRKRK